MAKFKTQCPLCLAEIHVHSQWAGQPAACPSCGETICIPAPPDGQGGDMPHITTCPACNATQSIPADITGRVKRNCSKCGTTYLFVPDISFPCAKKLPPDRNGNPRIACPKCGRHYVLKYTPHNGLIGCQECMSIFAHPDTEDQQPSVKHRPVLLPPPVASAPAAVSPSAPTVVFATRTAPPQPRPVIPRPVQPKQQENKILFRNVQPPAEPSENRQPQPVSPPVPASSLTLDDADEMVQLPPRPQINIQLPTDSPVQAQTTDTGKSLLKKFFSN